MSTIVGIYDKRRRILVVAKLIVLNFSHDVSPTLNTFADNQSSFLLLQVLQKQFCLKIKNGSHLTHSNTLVANTTHTTSFPFESDQIFSFDCRVGTHKFLEVTENQRLNPQCAQENNNNSHGPFSSLFKI
mmetsp:Transcript_9660/g.13513  ORF Transcript_9660/g.13513 Transcript_9660/m.13513 type:complete len:130 (-) Transcript_9660:629-1018(-)